MFATLVLGVAMAQQTPTFHADTRLVEVNVVVHKESRPVADLLQKDFSLSDRGTPREVAVFSVSSAAREKTAASPLPANTFSNRPQAESAQHSSNGATIILL